MRIESMREFIMVAKHQSYSLAAKELHFSQPSISMHISAMEKELGFAIVEHKSRRFSLTPAGLQFLEHAQAIVSLYDHAQSDGLLTAKKAPPIKMLPRLLGSRLFPVIESMTDVLVTYVEVAYEITATDAIARNLIDVAAVPDFSSIPLLREQFSSTGIGFFPAGSAKAAIAISKTNPLSEKTVIAPADIEGSTVSIYLLSGFEAWQYMIIDMIGASANLNFRLSPLTSATNLGREDLGDTLFVSEYHNTMDIFRDRDDVVLFSRIDDREILFPMAIAYSVESSKKHVIAFAEKLAHTMQDVGWD